MATTNGSATYFRGMPSTITERHDLVIDLPLKPGETVYKGQMLFYDNTVNQATSPAAGTTETGDTNGTVRALTNGDSYQTKAGMIGICLKNIDDSDTSANEYGKHIVPILIKGITLVRGIVNDTNNSDGYDIPFGAGNIAAVGGGAGGGSITGSNTVSGFTALTPGAYFFYPTGATDGSGNIPVGWFLDFQDGSNTDEILSDGTATIAASQAQSPQSGYWYRILVDMTACHSGTIVNMNG
jgi:hypothetical protein